jgi:hypothetical protein
VSIVASGMSRALAEPLTERGGQRSQHAAGSAASASDYRQRLSAAIGSPPPHDRPAGDRGEEWRAPGDVVIRQGPPQLAGSPPAARSAHHEAGALGPRSAGGYGSDAPMMPAVGDFPPVGQREYWAKTDAGRRGSQAVHHAQTDSPPRKPSLLQRLTGRDRRTTPIDRDLPLADQLGEPASEPTDEQLDVPVFFGRRLRK